jgi:hypothetical protein
MNVAVTSVTKATEYVPEEPGTGEDPIGVILTHSFDFGTVASGGYNVDGRVIELTNTVDSSKLNVTFDNAQTGKSTYSPHNVPEGNIIAVLNIDTAVGKDESSILFDFGTTDITKVEFYHSVWSPTDFGRIAQVTTAELQVWNSSNSSWTTVKSFLADLDSSAYTKVEEATLGSKFRIYVAGTSITGQSRITIDNVSFYTGEEITEPIE